jgi:hypothetical protein
VLAFQKEVPHSDGASLLDKHPNMPVNAPQEVAHFRGVRKSLPGKNHKSMHNSAVRPPNAPQLFANATIISCAYCMFGRVSRQAFREKRTSACWLDGGGKMTESYSDTQNGSSIGNRPRRLTPRRTTPTETALFCALIACAQMRARVSHDFKIQPTMYGAPHCSQPAFDPR